MCFDLIFNGFLNFKFFTKIVLKSFKKLNLEKYWKIFPPYPKIDFFFTLHYTKLFLHKVHSHNMKYPIKTWIEKLKHKSATNFPNSLKKIVEDVCKKWKLFLSSTSHKKNIRNLVNEYENFIEIRKNKNFFDFLGGIWRNFLFFFVGRSSSICLNVSLGSQNLLPRVYENFFFKKEKKFKVFEGETNRLLSFLLTLTRDRILRI